MKSNKGFFGKIKFLLKKLGWVFLFSAVLALGESYQHKRPTEFNVAMQDLVRKSHSKELLNKKTSKRNIRIFDGDAKFYKYITQYIKQNNKKINAEKFTKTLLKVSQTLSYDPIFLLAVIKTESDFDFKAIGTSGEIGLMQIKPDTAEWICNKLNIKWKGAKALKDPEYNIMVGAYYFKYLKKASKSKSLKYINAYNMGLTSMNRTLASNLKKHPYFGKVTHNYLAIYSELKKIKQKKLI